jgi:hypothetical protein
LNYACIDACSQNWRLDPGDERDPGDNRKLEVELGSCQESP